MTKFKIITDTQQLEKAFRYAKATTELEGLKVTTEDEKLIKSVMSGKITESEFMKKALEKR